LTFQPGAYRRSVSAIGTILISTRRFAAWPSGVSFEAFGCV
jgi:hypothetical protein